MTPAGIAFYLVPGLLLAWRGERLRGALADRGLGARIGTRLLQWSALGYALRGAFVPDAGDPGALATRLHALAWSLWWLAFVAGACLLAASARRGRPFAAACLGAAVLLPWLVLSGPAWFGPRAAAWLANAAWWAWWALAAWALRPRFRPLRGG